MELILNHEQEELLKRTRAVLGNLREALAATGAAPPERKALTDSIRQLDELFLLVVAGSLIPASRPSSTRCWANRCKGKA
jgi:hypothetical protein